MASDSDRVSHGKQLWRYTLVPTPRQVDLEDTIGGHDRLSGDPEPLPFHADKTVLKVSG